MAKTESNIARLSELNDGESGDCFVCLVEKERRQTRNGNPFFLVHIRDRERRVAVRIWNDSDLFAACEQEWAPGDFFKVRGTFQLTEWGPQFEIDRIRAVTDADRNDGFDPDDFRERTRYDVDAMYRELSDLAEEHITNPALLRLTQGILDQYEAEVKRIPAATHNHHAYVGGFLEHVLSVTRTAVYLADKYIDYYNDLDPPISKSLVVAGAILHDIGKLRELDTAAHKTEYSVPGRLLGHMILGRDIVRELVQEIPDFPPELLLGVEHIIAAHQGRPEWGAVVEPCTVECLLVHYADDIDAKTNIMVQAIQKDQTVGPFTSRDNPMRRKLYKREEPA